MGSFFFLTRAEEGPHGLEQVWSPHGNGLRNFRDVEALYAGAAALLDSKSGLEGFPGAGARPYFSRKVPAIWLPGRDAKDGTFVHSISVTPEWLEAQYANVLRAEARAEIKVSRQFLFGANYCYFVSSTRVEDRPREVVSSEQEPNGRDVAKGELFESTSDPPISVVDLGTGRSDARPGRNLRAVLDLPPLATHGALRRRLARGPRERPRGGRRPGRAHLPRRGARRGHNDASTRVEGCRNQVPPTTLHTCAQQRNWMKCGEPWMAERCCRSCHGCREGCGDTRV